MKKTLPFLASIVMAFTVISLPTALAAPSISSSQNQTFQENQSPSPLRTVIITESEDEALITAEKGISISIPAGIMVIFDTNRVMNEIELSGSALTTGKVVNKPEVTFTNKDKTIIIPVIKDFDPSETLNIHHLAVKGFHQKTESSEFLELVIDESLPYIQDQYSLRINSSSLQDRVRPEIPSELTLVQESLSTLRVTWVDPTDLDLYRVKVYRGKVGVAPSEIVEITPGVQNYEDTGLVVGETYSYQVQATDGRSLSGPSGIVSLTLVEDYIVEEEVVVPEEEVIEEEAVTEPETDTETVNEEESSEPLSLSQELEIYFDDLSTVSERYKEGILALTQKGVLKGRSSRTFAPEGTALRSEFAKMIVLAFEFTLSGDSKSFPDVDPEAWFADYVATLLEKGIMLGSNGLALPSNSINRAEAVAMVIRSLNLQDAEVSGTIKYTDVDTEDWFHDDVIKAQERGLLTWVEDDTSFSPAEFITRQELSVLIHYAVSSRGAQ